MNFTRNSDKISCSDGSSTPPYSLYLVNSPQLHFLLDIDQLTRVALWLLLCGMFQSPDLSHSRILSVGLWADIMHRAYYKTTGQQPWKNLEYQVSTK